MNVKTLAILALITAAVVFAAMKWSSPDAQKDDDTDSPVLLPELSAQLDNIQKISIQTASDSFSLSKHGEQWGLDSHDDYPAASNKVNALLLGLAGLTRLEAGTANPELYSRIGVEPVTDTDAKSVLVSVASAEKPITALLVGNSSVAKTDATQQEIYVREAEAKQSWRVMGKIPLQREALEWVEKEIADINTPNIQSVMIQPTDGEPIHIFKESADQAEFTVANLPEKATAKTSDVTLLAGFLSNLNLDSVSKLDTVQLPEKADFIAVFKQFDGLTVQMTVKTAEDGKRYAVFMASAPEEAEISEAAADSGDETAVTGDSTTETATAEADSTKDSETAQDSTADAATPAETKPSATEQAASLNQRWQGWAYVLPDWKLERIVLEGKALYDLPEEEKTNEAADIEDISVMPEAMPVIPETVE